MISPPLPKYVLIPSDYIEQVFDLDKPRRTLLTSFIRILSLAWESKYQKTPELSEGDLIQFLKISRRQYFDQKSDMELLGWIKSTHPNPGKVQFIFNSLIFGESAENRTLALEEEVESINTIKLIESTSSSSESAENCTEYPSVKKILESTDKLFGHPGVLTSGLDLDKLEPWTVLGWIGLAWDQWRDGGKNGNLFAPAGVVYNKLADPSKPHAGGGFHEGAWRHILPAEYLEALDLAEYECSDCGEVFQKGNDFEAHRLTHGEVIEVPEPAYTITGDETIREKILSTGYTAESIWLFVLEQLQIEMTPASFTTWLQDTKPVHYENEILTIGVRNQYACDWIVKKMKSTIDKLIREKARHDLQVIYKIVTSD